MAQRQPHQQQQQHCASTTTDYTIDLSQTRKWKCIQHSAHNKMVMKRLRRFGYKMQKENETSEQCTVQSLYTSTLYTSLLTAREQRKKPTLNGRNDEKFAEKAKHTMYNTFQSVCLFFSIRHTFFRWFSSRILLRGFRNERTKKCSATTTHYVSYLM